MWGLHVPRSHRERRGRGEALDHTQEAELLEGEVQPLKDFNLASGLFRFKMSAPGAAARAETRCAWQKWPPSLAGGPGVQRAGFWPERPRTSQDATAPACGAVRTQT